MTAPRGRRGAGGGQPAATSGVGAAMEGSSLRGALLIAVAVVVGVVLLGKGLEGGIIPSTAQPPSEQAGDGSTGATTPATNPDGTPASTTAVAVTPTTHVPAQVKVQVLNG